MLGLATLTAMLLAAVAPSAGTARGQPARGAAPAGSALVAGPRITDPEEIEPAIARAINATRRRHRLRPLAVTPPLARAGDAHARALAVAGLFTHDWPDGRPLARWMAGFYPSRGFRSWTVGENLLWSAVGVTPESAVKMWLDSPAHRRLMLMASWREIGVGVVYAERAAGSYGGLNVYVVAAEFGARS